MTPLAVTIVSVAAIVTGGILLAVQAPINSALARSAGDPLVGAMISFGVGFAVLAAILAVRGTAAGFGGLANAPWWAWIGGFLGAFYVVAVIWAVPKLGVVTTTAALVFGQVAAAMALDAIGAFGLPVQSISWTRAVAAGLVLGGVVLSRVG